MTDEDLITVAREFCAYQACIATHAAALPRTTRSGISPRQSPGSRNSEVCLASNTAPCKRCCGVDCNRFAHLKQLIADGKPDPSRRWTEVTKRGSAA